VNALPSPEYNKKAVWAAIHSSAGTLGTCVGHWRRRPPGYLAIFSTFARLRPTGFSGLSRPGLPLPSPLCAPLTFSLTLPILRLLMYYISALLSRSKVPVSRINVLVTGRRYALC
jgi:hypothetical protein